MIYPSDDIVKGVIRAVKSRGLPRAAAVAAVSTVIAECGAVVMYANDGRSTLNDAYLHRQLTDHERAVAAESLNYPHDLVGRDLDSMGLYQQRPMSGWGPPAELMDPEASTAKFLDGVNGNRGLVDIPGWRELPPWEAGRRVQGSLPKDSWLYSGAYQQACEYINRLWGDDGPLGILEWISANVRT